MVGELAHGWRDAASAISFSMNKHCLALMTGGHAANIVAAATLASRHTGGSVGVLIHSTRLMRPGEFALWSEGALVFSGLLGSRLEPMAFDAIAVHVDDGAVLWRRLGARRSCAEGCCWLVGVRRMTADMAHASITLAELAASGRHVVVQCGRCPNRRLSRTTDLDLPIDTPVTLVGALLKCCEWGSTEVLVYPESNRDARRGWVR